MGIIFIIITLERKSRNDFIFSTKWHNVFFFSCGYVFLVFYVHIWLIFENKFIFELPLKSKIIFGNWSLISIEKEKYSKIGDEESYWFVRNYPMSINDAVSEMSPDDCWGIWEGYWHFAPPPPDLLKNCEFTFYIKPLITNFLISRFVWEIQIKVLKMK